MPESQRKPLPEDAVFRVVAPDQYDEEGPFATAFEDRGKGRKGEPSETLSFTVKRPATPADALRAISNRAKVRADCGTGKQAATPAQMYAAGYRVAAMPAEHIIRACRAPAASLRIKPDQDGSEIEPNGHLQITDGHKLSDTWARHSTLLGEGETVSS